MDRYQLFAAQAQSQAIAADRQNTLPALPQSSIAVPSLKGIDVSSKSCLDASMKIRAVGLTLVFSFFGAAVCLAADPQAGTWRLNESKSKITPGTLKNTQVVYSSMFGQVKVKSDGIDANGKPMHTEWSGKLDGKDYPVTGDPNSDTRSYTKVNDRTLTTANKKNGKVRVTGQIVISADGKSRTITVTGNTPKGKKFKNVAVYDRQ
jgi:hypothetical protein